MNAIVQTEAPRPSLQSGGTVRAIVPQDFDGAWRIATAVCKAGMAPQGLDTPEKAMVAIMHGMEVGLTPMAALQSIAVVNGRPTIWGDGAIGLVRGSGKLEWIKERIDGDGDKMVAVCEVKRKGEPDAVRATFSVDDAKKASLWNKTGRNGQPTPWITYPKRMLAMRARAFALRDAFADVLRGLGIAEEVQDTPMRDVTPKPPAPPAPPPSDAGRIQEAETVDVETGEVSQETSEDTDEFVLGDFLEELRNSLDLQTDEAGVEEIWSEFDPESTLETKGHGDMIMVARTMREKRLAALSEAA